jgi:WD40 repeat protein
MRALRTTLFCLLLLTLTLSASAQGGLNCQAAQTRVADDNAGNLSIRSESTGYGSRLIDMAWSHDGDFLLGVFVQRLRVLCNDSGAPLIVPNNRHNSFSISSDDRYIALSTGRELILADLATGQKVIKTLQKFSLDVEFFPSGSLVAVGNGDDTLQIYDTSGFNWTLVTKSKVGTRGAPVHSLKFSPDGRYLVGVADYGSVVVWDVSALPVLNSPVTLTQGRVSDVSFSATGQLALGVVPFDEAYPNVIVYDPVSTTNGTTWELAYTLSGLGWDNTTVDFSPDGALLATYTDYQGEPREYPNLSSTISLWNAQTGQPAGSFIQPDGENGLISTRGVHFHPDGTLIAVAGREAITLWGVAP